MAERKAVNKYYPPDWDPRKGSANKRVGQHPLRDRAKKLSQGILVIRFELPYNIWCGGCGNHIGMGVRYNAEKSKVGNYYSTPIYKFRMKCHLCDNYFEIQTDPKNHDYVILSGARRKEQRWDPVENEQVVPEDKSTQKKLATDPMYKLEHGTDDQQKGKNKVMSLAQIEESRISMIDDYYLNRIARDKFRAEKKQLKESAEADKAILERASLSINLVEESEADRRLAGLMKYSVTSSFEEKQKERRNSIEQRPIFSTGDFPLPTSVSVSSSSSNALSNPKHSPATPSQHGDLKHTLGKVLQATYKDPFKFVGKNTGVNKSSSSKQNPSRLGVRLKSSESTRFVSSELLREGKGDKTGVVVTSCQHKETIPGQNCNLESVIISNVSTSRFLASDVSTVTDGATEEQANYNSAGSASQLFNKSSQFSCAPGVVLITPETDPPPLAVENNNCYIELKGQLDISSSNEQEHTDKTEQPACSPAPLDTRRFDLNKSTDADLLNTSNTGLQTLLCSYTDSDSE